MPQRLFVDAGAQSTVASPITAAQTTVTLASATGFGAVSAGQQLSVVILDSGNSAWDKNNPLATPYEYQPVTGISGNVLTFGGGTRAAYAGTTPHAYFAGATVAGVALAEDWNASFPIKIARILVGTDVSAPAASVTFSSIPTGYANLWIDYQAKSDTAAFFTDLVAQINGDTGNNYSFTAILAANGSSSVSAASSTSTSSASVGLMSGASRPSPGAGSGRIVIPNYAGVTFGKQLLGQSLEGDSGGNNVRSHYGIWNPGTSAAVGSILLKAAAGNLIAGSRFDLYVGP